MLSNAAALSSVPRRLITVSVCLICAASIGLMSVLPSTRLALLAMSMIGVLVVIGTMVGWKGVIATVLVASALPLPMIPLGSARFGIANFFPLVVLSAALSVRSGGGAPLRFPLWRTNLVLLVVALSSVSLSWLWWDPLVGTGAELGRGHRWVGYQLAGLFFLLLPFVAFSAGAVYRRVGNPKAIIWSLLIALPVTIIVSLAQVPASGLVLDPSGQVSHGLGVDYVDAVLLAVLCLAVCLHAGSRLIRVASILGFVLSCAVIGATFFLNAWIAIALAISVMVWQRAGLRGVMALTGIGMFVAVVMGGGLGELLSVRFGGYDLDRLRLWTDALHIFWLRPVLGVGSGNLTSYVETYSSFSLLTVIAGYHQVHNSFLEILAEIGVLGFTLFAAFLFRVLRLLSSPTPVDSSSQATLRSAGLGMLAASSGMAFFAAGLVPTVSSAGWTSVTPVVITWFVAGIGVWSGVAAVDGVHSDAGALPRRDPEK
jgi:O-antigen ligase